jgi:hypothetical protein
MRLGVFFYKTINLIYISAAIILFIILTTNLLIAADLTASKYELTLSLDHLQEVTSNIININSVNFTKNNSTGNNVYLDNFTLKNKKGNEIPSHYIKIETPYFQNTLENSYRFLIMKKDQEKSWFKIGLITKTAYLDPGKYEGIINIDGLDWQINVNVVIKPFVNLYLKEKRLEFKITNPFQSDFFISPDLYELNVKYNHSDWEIQASLENEFVNERGNIITAANLFYRLEDLNQQNDLDKLKIEQFKNFNKSKNIIIIHGNDYQNGLTAIRFGVNLTGESSSVLPAGLYSGNIIFTLRTLNNKL